MQGITLFFGKLNPEFSNMYIAPFKINDEVFNSVEHYFMTVKGRLFDPQGEATLQMGNDKTPKQMKSLGRRVRNFNPESWDYHGKKAMYEGVYAKFNQNLLLQQSLLYTGYNILAEASPWDRKWGIGRKADGPNAYKVETWGRNWLGLILMGVRAELRYGQLDRTDIVVSDFSGTTDFFGKHDWDDTFWRWNDDPKSWEEVNWKDICALATGDFTCGETA